MTKRIVSGVFLLIALGALGLILAGALTSGEQLIVRFLTAIIVAALGLYVISDLRLQADDSAAASGTRPAAVSATRVGMAADSLPPNSTAAFMATVTGKKSSSTAGLEGTVWDRPGEPVERIVAAEVDPADDLDADPAHLNPAAVGSTYENVVEESRIPKMAAVTGAIPIAADEETPSDLVAASAANGVPVDAKMNDEAEVVPYGAEADVAPLWPLTPDGKIVTDDEIDLRTDAAEIDGLVAIFAKKTEQELSCRETAMAATAAPSAMSAALIAVTASVGGGGGYEHGRDDEISNNGHDANRGTGGDHGQESSGDAGRDFGRESGRTNGQDRGPARVSAFPGGFDLFNEGPPERVNGNQLDGAGMNGSHVNGSHYNGSNGQLNGQAANNSDDLISAGQDENPEMEEKVTVIETPAVAETPAGAEPTAIETPAIAPASAPVPAAKVVLDRPTTDGQAATAAVHTSTQLAPILDLRMAQLSGAIDEDIETAIRSGEVDVISSLIDQGVLTHDGPITDRDVRTMVYVAFTSNELRKILHAGGIPDGDHSDLDLGDIEVFRDQPHDVVTAHLDPGRTPTPAGQIDLRGDVATETKTL